MTFEYFEPVTHRMFHALVIASYSVMPSIGYVTTWPSRDPRPLLKWQLTQENIVLSTGMSPCTSAGIGSPEARIPSLYMRSPIFKASTGDRPSILDCIDFSANEIPYEKVSRTVNIPVTAISFKATGLPTILLPL